MTKIDRTTKGTPAEGSKPNALRHSQEAFNELKKGLISIASHRHRLEAFRDFVFFSAAALHNAVAKDERIEEEYLRRMGDYKTEDAQSFAQLLAKLMMSLEARPRDVLGELYMDMGLGNARTGQFYTPESVTRFISEITMGDIDKQFEKRGYITISEPAAGSGGMVLPAVEMLLERGHDPARKMFVQAVDVDRTAALMCYVQLSLWNVPAEVVVGNSLTLEVRERWFTPAYHLFGWDARRSAELAAASTDPSEPEDLPAA